MELLFICYSWKTGKIDGKLWIADQKHMQKPKIHFPIGQDLKKYLDKKYLE